MDSLDELYQDIIIDHNHHPRCYGTVETSTTYAEGYNDTCGDEINVYLSIDEHCIQCIHFSGQGCAISKASASMMCEILTGKSVQEAKIISKLIQLILSNDQISFHSPINDIHTYIDDIYTLSNFTHDTCDCISSYFGDLVALEGVKQFPMRIKCATLAWHTFDEAINK